MAALNDNDRINIWAEVMRLRATDLGAPVVGLTKAELRAAVDAVDVWLDANSAALNAAIPQPARGALTSRQKAAILSAVIARRFVRA